jgi:DNA-binding NarL/FixJ family response regulator
VPTVRTVLIGMSPMLRDIVKECIGNELDLEIVGEFGANEWTGRVRSVTPEVIIVSLRRDEADDDVASRLLKEAPTAKVVALSSDNRRALCYIMPAYRRVISDFSSQEITTFIGRPH